MVALHFGSGYLNPRHVKKRFLSHLCGAIDYCPDARVRPGEYGLHLEPSATRVAPRRPPMKL